MWNWYFWRSLVYFLKLWNTHVKQWTHTEPDWKHGAHCCSRMVCISFLQKLLYHFPVSSNSGLIFLLYHIVHSITPSCSFYITFLFLLHHFLFLLHHLHVPSTSFPAPYISPSCSFYITFIFLLHHFLFLMHHHRVPSKSLLVPSTSPSCYFYNSLLHLLHHLPVLPVTPSCSFYTTFLFFL